MTDASWRQRFRSVLASYGVPFVASLYRTYESWCAANPNHPTCSSRAAMRAFANYWSSKQSITTAPRKTSQKSAVSAAPVQVGTRLKVGHNVTAEKGNVVLRATDLISLATSPTPTAEGTNLLLFTFAPTAQYFDGSRFQAFAALYEKYRVRRLRFHYQPACPTSTAGQVVMAWDNDPADPAAGAGDPGVRQLLSYRNNVVFSVFEPASLSVTFDDSVANYYTSPGTEPRLSSPGTMQLAAVAAVPNATTLGSVWIEYEVEFSSPSEPRAGPFEDYLIAYSNGTVLVSSTTASLYDDVTSAGGTIVALGLTTAADSAGHTGVVLQTGTYLIEVECLQQSTSLAAAVGNATTVLQPGSTVTYTAALVNIAAPASVNSSIRFRQSVVVVGSVVYHPTISALCSFSKVWTRVSMMSTTPTTAAGVDQYPF